jgi:hypothetical protein
MWKQGSAQGVRTRRIDLHSKAAAGRQELTQELGGGLAARAPMGLIGPVRGGLLPVVSFLAGFRRISSGFFCRVIESLPTAGWGEVLSFSPNIKARIGPCGESESATGELN